MSLFKKKKKEPEKKFNIVIQEDQNACKELINALFEDVLKKDTITDIYYNGKEVYLHDIYQGRIKYNNKYEEEKMLDFIKKIANYMLKPFSYKNPILDVAFYEFRLTATHPTLARNEQNKVVTFAIRRITPTIKIKMYDETIAPQIIYDFLEICMKSYQNILISGKTGSGKTELQKFLISLMDEKDRIIMIEESYETHIKEIFQTRDITNWIVDKEKDELSQFIRLALRSNPDWLIIAETRGDNEAYDMVQSILTGHNAITTIHSDSAEKSLNRISKMCIKKIEMEVTNFLSLLAEYIKIGIHMEKVYRSDLARFVYRICEICEYIPIENGYKVNMIYKVERINQQDKYTYGTISQLLKKELEKNCSVSKIEKLIKTRSKKNEEK